MKCRNSEFDSERKCLKPNVVRFRSIAFSRIRKRHGKKKPKKGKLRKNKIMNGIQN